MEAFIVITIIVIVLFGVIHQNRKNQALIASVTESNRGNSSERNLVLALRKLDIHPDAIYHDLYLPKRNGSYAQIDLVMATSVGLIVFEVKDYSGWIFGSGHRTYWTQVLAFGRQKFRMYNPVIQNRRHIEELQKCSPQFAQIPMFSIIVFYGNCKLKKLDGLPNRVFVIKPNELKHTINSITSNYPRANYSNKREIVNVLREASKNGENEKIVQSHITYVELVKNQINAKDGRITNEWNFNPFPPQVRRALRWLRNWR